MRRGWVGCTHLGTYPIPPLCLLSTPILPSSPILIPLWGTHLWVRWCVMPWARSMSVRNDEALLCRVWQSLKLCSIPIRLAEIFLLWASKNRVNSANNFITWKHIWNFTWSNCIQWPSLYKCCISEFQNFPFISQIRIGFETQLMKTTKYIRTVSK